MAESHASVRLTLKDRGFVRTFMQLGNKVGQAAKGMGGRIGEALHHGVEGGVDALKELGNKVKEVGGLVTGIAGGIGLEKLIHGSIEAETKFRNLATAIEIGTGEATNWVAIQERAKAVSQSTGIELDKVGDAMDELFSGTKDFDFMTDAIKTVGTTSRATGDEVVDLAKIAATLKQKFDITAKDLPEAMSMVVSAAHAGGASVEDLADDFAEVGGKAKSMGAVGVGGLKQMLGILNLAKQESGSFQQAMTAIPQIFDQILERQDKGVIKSAGKIPIEIGTVDEHGRKRSPAEILSDIIMTTKGNAAELGQFGFGGEGLQTILALAKTFHRELDATGGDIKTARAHIAKAIDAAAGGTLSWGRIQEKAAENMDSGQGRIDRALAKLQAAFTSPPMLDALGKLTEVLPTVADGLAKVVEFVAKNPLTAGGLAVEATFAKGFLSQALSGAGGVGGAIGKAALGGLEGGAPEVGVAMAGAFGPIFMGIAAAAAALFAYDAINRFQREQAYKEEFGKARKEGTAPKRGSKFLEMDQYGNVTERSQKYEQNGDTAGQAYVRKRLVEGGVLKPSVLGGSGATVEPGASLGGIEGPLTPEMERQFGGGAKGPDKSLKEIIAGIKSPLALNAPTPQIQVKTDPSAATQQASQMARETAAAVGRQELRVRVINADEIRPPASGSGGSGATSRPGSAS